MKKNSMRFLSFLLATIMVVSLFPMGIFAENSSNDAGIVVENSGASDSKAETNKPTVTEGMDFTASDAAASGEGWAWDNVTKTLTLKGVSVQTNIVLPDGSTIHVEDGTESDVAVASGNAIYVDGTLTINGAGKLSVESGFDTADARAIRATASISVEDTELSAKAECAVAAPTVSITDSKVDLYGYYYGIHAKTTAGEADSTVVLRNVSGKIAGYGYGGINAHSETANVWVELDGCHDLEIYNEVENDSASVNFNFAGIRAYTRGSGKDAMVSIAYCEDVTIQNSTMAILAASNANAANPEVAESMVYIKESTGIKLVGNTSTYSAVFVNNYGIENNDSAVLSIAYSEVEVLAPNATGLMTSTKSAPSEVDVAESDVTITAGLTGIRTIASSADYADTDVTGSTVTFVLPAGHNAVDESVGTVVADEAFADEASTITVKKPAVTYEVATKDELVNAIANAADGDTVKLTADIESDAVIAITKAITLDLGGYKLTTTNGWGGLQLKNGCSVKNGTLLHTGRVNAIRAWDVVSLEDLVIEVTDTTEGKTVGGISIQENAAGIDTIKNVTLKGVGLDYGIETYNCGNAQVIGTMENVNIDAVGTGMAISAPCGTATNCTIKGGVSGIDMLLKGTYSVSIDLVNCTVEGGEQAVYAHDEQMGYTYVGSIKLTADEETDFVNANGVYLKEEIASTTSADLDDVRNYNVTFIGSIDELLAFAQAANAGNTFKGETVKLTADLDFNGGNWLEIDENGTVVTDFRIPNFAGTFDGQDHVIRNFNYVVSQSGNHRAMMFSGTLTGIVKNLKVENVTATIAGGATRVAAVANTINANSATNARLDNVHVKNFTVNCDNLTTDQTWFGGLSVYTNGGNLAIKDCSVTDFTLNANGVYMGSAVSSCITPNNDFVNVTVTNFTANIDTVSGVFGGFAGQTQSGGTNASFTNCHVIGLDVDIKEITGDNVGGFMSTIGAATQFYNCSTQGTIDVTEDTLTTISVGGFIGDHGWNGMYGPDRQHEFKNCVADVDITAVSANVGGFVGNSTIAGHPERHIPAYFVGCEAKGDVKTTNGAAGGFVGQGDRGLFTDCSASGNVTGNIAGGFWGYIYPKTKAEAMGSTHQDPLSKSILLDGCVATGTVEGTAYEAGLIGFMKDVYVDANNELGYATPVILSGNTPSDYNRFDYSGYGEAPDITVYVATVNGQGYETLAEAIAAANAVDGGATVTLLADVTLGEKLTITGNVTISGKYTITRADTYTGNLFTVNAGATLTLDGGLTIDGGNAWTYTVFPPIMDMNNGAGTYVANHITPAEGGVDATAHMIVNNGTLNVHSVTIENSYSTGGFSIINAGASSVTTLNGATICHNAANRSGAIAYIGGNDAVLTIKGTTRITDNFGIGNGGIIQNYGQGTTVNFEGGSIDNNFVGKSGTLYASYSSNANKINTFNMTGGIITKNVMEGYGPVYIHTNTVWNMTGGEISENISFLPSYVRNNNPAGSMTGGKIVNNEITGLDYSNGYYVTHPDLRLNGKTAITGGTYTQDVSEYLAPNTGLEYVNGQYTVINEKLFKLHLTDPNTGEPATIPYLEGGNLAELVAYGKLFYANYYKMTLEVLYDVKIDETVVIDYPMTIDLNGHTLTADTSMNSTPVFRVVADVTVTGNGKIDGRPGTSSYAFIVGQGENAGNLTIENGTFYGSVTAVSVTKGTATINGGNFAADPYVVDGEENYNFLLNCIDTSYKDGTAKIFVKGGTFYKFNPADNAAEGAGTSFVAENYLAEADGDYYTVRVNKDTLPTVADVVITLKGGQTITLTYPSERFDTIQKLIGTNDYADFVLGAEQSELLAYAANGNVTEIVMNLYDDIALDAPINFYNKYFQVSATYDITINGNNNTITWADGYNGTLINVESGVGVTLNKLNIFGENTFSFYDDTTTVEDGQNWYTRFVDVGEEDKAINANVIVNAGDLTLNSVTIAGVTIASDGSNGKTANTESGGYYLMYNDDLAIIKSNGGTVALNGSRIDNNAGLILNAINAKTEINGTGITNNMGAGNKGGIIIANGGTMSIKDATINNNKAMARSATILGVINGAVVSFNGFSTMDNNKHIGVGSNTAGAMIVLEGASQFVMNGGSISNNIGGRAGAIASRWSTADAMIELVSGTIKGNTASNDSWNGADIFLRSPATIGAGMKVDGIIAVNQAPGELDITGGTFTNFELIVADGLSAEITGGTFDNDPSEWLADGYVAPKNDDGTYTARAQTYAEWVKEQLLAGNDVTLTEDIVITDYDLVNAIPLPSNGNGRYNEAHGNGAVFHITKPGVVLDLNGHSITWDAHDDAYCNKRQVSLFMVTATGVAGETADFTITDSVGTGKVDVYGMGSGVYVVLKTAKATVEGGTWTNYPCKTCGASNIFLYPSHGGTLEITGGTFEQKNGEYLLGCFGSTKETNDNGVGVDYDSTQIIISGGTFVGFNPENVKFIDIANGGAESEINGCELGYMAKDNGNGTYGIQEWDLVIRNTDDLLRFAAMVNAGNTFAGKTIVLGADINLAGIEWAPIGGDNVYFAGEFDGNGKTIENLTQTTGARMGLFGLIEKAYIHDLTMKNVTFVVNEDNARVGAIAGNLQYWNVVEDVTIDGINITINGNDGLVGSVAGYVWKSQLGNVDVKNAVVTINGTGNVFGGHTGYGRAHVWDTNVTGNNANWLDGSVQTIDGTEYVLQNYFVDCDVDDIVIEINGKDNEVGGFFGSDTYNSHSNYFVDCHVTDLLVNVAEGTSQIVGGFIAWNNGTTSAGTVKGFDGCSVSGTINGADGTYGGFVGQVGGRACEYYNASADVDITCTGTAGGFVGITQQYFTHLYTFTDCVATGDVKGTVAGGFAGKNALGGDGDNINVGYYGCSASGKVNATSIAGGFIGEVNTELPATNWSTVEGKGNLYLYKNVASKDVTGDTVVGYLIGYLDGVANGDAKEGNTVALTLDGNDPNGSDIGTGTGHHINVSGDTVTDDIVVYLVSVTDSEGNVTMFATLAKAIEAAKPGYTITLLADITENVTVNKDLIIDGNSFEYTGTMTLNQVNVTIQNVDFVKGNIYKHKSTGIGGNYVIKNCTFDGQNSVNYAIDLGGTTAITVENCTAKNYSYGFLQVPATNNSVTVKDVTVSGMNYGVKIDYSNGVTLENVNITAKVAGVLNSTYGAKTITIKNSTINSIVTWVRNVTFQQTVVFEGANTVGDLSEAALTTLKLADGATLTAPEGLTVITDKADHKVVYENGTYKVVAKVYVAEVNGVKYESLQAAIDACVVGNNTITLLGDTDEDVTIKQVEGVNVTIDGASKTYSGTITIHGNARYTGAETLTIKNVKFVTDKAGHYFIDSNSTGSVERYAHNVTVEGCLFVAEGAAINSAAAVRIRQGFNIKLVKNLSENLHSLFQGYGCAGFSAEANRVTGKNGISVGTSTGVKIIGNEIVATGYGVRADGTSESDMFFEANTITAELPLVIRNVTGSYELTMGRKSTLNASNADGYQIVFTQGDDGTYIDCTGYFTLIKDAAHEYEVYPFDAYVAFVGDRGYVSLQDAINACKNGETVKLVADITYDADDIVFAHGGATGFGNYDHYNPSIIYVGGTKGETPAQNLPSDVNVVIDLNGHTITNNADAYLFLFMDNCQVTFTDSLGDGKIISHSTNYPSIWACGTDTLVTIEKGYYETDSALGLLHATHAGDLVIYGGEFKTTAEDASLLIMLNSQKYNNPNYFLKGVATVTIYGGIFHGFNPNYVGDDYGASSIEDIKFVDGCAENYEPVDNGDGTYGVVPTKLIKVEVEMIPGAWGTSYITVENWADLVAALGEYTNLPIKITLLDNVEITEPLVISGNKTVVINLNGKTMTGVDVYPVIRVQGGADVTVTGNGSIINETDYVFVLGSADKTTAGNLTIENGTFIGNTTVASVTKGILTVKGGYFETNGDEYGATYLLNCIDESYRNGTASIIVTGGTFAGFDPANNAAEGAGTNFVAKGYKSVDNDDGTFTVEPNMIFEIHLTDANGEAHWLSPMRSNDLASVLKTAKVWYESLQGTYDFTLKILGDWAVDSTVVVDYPMTIDLGGYTISAEDTVNTSPVFRILSDVTVKNGTVDGRDGFSCYAFIVGNSTTAGSLTIVDGKYYGDVSAVSVTNGTLTVEGGYFEGTEYNGAHEFTLNCIDSAYNNGNAVIVVKGGTFYKFNPENNAAEGVGTDFVHDYYKAYVDPDNSDCYLVEKVTVTIGSVEDLLAFAAAVTGNTEYQGVKVAANPDAVVLLTADLDLTDSGFAGIGNGAANTFSGTFDGQDHTISNMTLSCNYYRGVGFFRSLGKGAVIKNLTFENADVNNGAATGANHFYGVVAGFSNDLTLDNVNVIDSKVTCKYAGSALVGCLEGATTVKNCDIENVTLRTNNIRGAVFGILGNSANGHTIVAENNTVTDFSFIVNDEFKDAELTLGYGAWNSGNAYAEESYVAQIGDTKYSTLANAIAAAKDGDTITLIGDVTRAATLIVDKDVTIDFNGHTVNGSELITNAPVIRVLADVTVKNGSVDGRDGFSCYAFIVGNGTTAGSLTIVDGKYYGDVSVVSVTNGTLTVEGGYFEGTEYNGAHEFTLNCIDSAYKNGNAVIVVKGGTFYKFDPANNASEGVGTDYVADLYESIDNGDDTYTVRAETLVSVKVEAIPGVWLTSNITVKNWADLVAALGEYTNLPVKVVFEKDVVLPETLVIKGNKSVVIDLNGKTVEGMLENHADLTVNDTVGGGKIDGNVAAIDNYGVLTVNGGSFSGDGSAIYNNEITDGQAEVTIYGGEFTAPGDYGATIENRYGILTVNGGKIVATNPAGYAIVDTYGKTTVTGGEIVSAQGTALETYGGEIVINDGTLVGKVIVENQAGNVTVYGGTLVSNTPEYYYGMTNAYGGVTVLYGGTYERDYATAEGTTTRIADGYKAVANTDGTFTVKRIITVKFDDATMTYGDELPKFTYTTNFTEIAEDGEMLFVNQPVISGTNVGTYEIKADAYVFMSDKYAIEIIPGTLTIEKAKVTVKFDDATMVYGNELPKFTYTTNFTEIAQDGEMLAVSNPVINVTGAGTYVIDADAYVFMSNNYDVEVIPGTLTVQKAALSVDGVFFTDLDSAKSSIKRNSVIKLYDDIEYGKTVVDGSNKFVEFKFSPNLGDLVIDLNGHDLIFHFTATIQYGTTLTIKDSSGVPGTIRNTNGSYPFVINSQTVVNLVDGVNFDCTIQMNCTSGLSGYFQIDGKNIIGETDSLFVAGNSYIRLALKQNYLYVETIAGTLTLAEDWKTLAGQTVVIGGSTGVTVAEGVTLTIDPTTQLTIKGYLNGEGTVVVNTLEHFEQIMATDIKNIEIGSTIVLSEDYVLDLAGKKITSSEGVNPAFRVTDGAKVTVKNADMDTAGYAFILGASDGSSDGYLTIENGKFHSVTTVVSVTNGKLTVLDGEFSVTPYNGNYAYLLNCIDANYSNGTASIEISGGIFHNWDPEDNAAEGKNTNFVADLHASVEIDENVWKVVDVIDVTVTLEDKTMVIGNAQPEYTYFLSDATLADVIKVTFNAIDVTAVGTYDITATVEADSLYNVTVVDATLTVVDAVAQIGSVNFASLRDALNAAEDGNTIVILKDHAMDGTDVVNDTVYGYDNLAILDGTAVTLDFNGHTVSVKPDCDANDDNALENCLESVIFVANGGSLTVTDTVGNGGFYVTKGTNLYCLIYNSDGSTVTVQNGNFYVEETVQNGAVIYADANNTTSIEGGNFTLVNAGTYDNTKPWITNVEGKNSGNFVQVTGGTFNQNPYLNRFTQKDWEVNVPENFAVVNNGNGTWSVVPAVVYIEEDYIPGYKTGYATLADALAAVENGETIVFVKDFSENVTIKQEEDLSFTINGNGKIFGGTITIDGAGRYAGEETLTITNVNFLVETDGQSSIITKKSSLAHNVTIDGCTFTGTDAQYDYGITLQHAYDITVKNVTGTKLYDLVYGKFAVTGFVAEDVTVTETGTGFWFTSVKNASFKNVNVKAENAIGVKNAMSGTMTFEDCSFEAEIPVYMWLSAADVSYSMVFNGTNSMVATNGGSWLVIKETESAGFKVTLNDTGLDAAGIDTVVAMIGDNVYYNSVAYAVKDAQDGETVVVIADDTSAKDIIANNNVTLDLNGYDVTGNLTVNGNLTIIDSTVDEAAKNYDDAGHLNGTVTVADGATLTLYAGIYNQNVDEYCADHYLARDNKDGTWTVCRGVVFNKTYGTSFMTIADAVANAMTTAGEDYLILLEDHEEFLVTILNGVTLDLQNYTLTAQYVFGVKGGYLTAALPDKNGNNGGLLKAPKDRVALGADAYVDADGFAIVQVWDKDINAYRFSRVNILMNSTDDSIKRGFYLEEKKDGTLVLTAKFKLQTTRYTWANILDDGQASHGLRVVVTASWTSEDGKTTQSATFSDEYVHYTFYANDKGQINDYVAYVAIAGHENLTMTVQVITDTGIVVQSETANAVAILAAAEAASN